MMNKLLIVPGYLLGISSLSWITYQTVVAFLSDSKSITVYVNRYGEQYADIVSLVVLWVISLIGLIGLIYLMKKEK